MYEVNSTKGDPDHHAPPDIRLLNLFAQALPELVLITQAGMATPDGRKSLLGGWVLIVTALASKALSLSHDEATAGLEFAIDLHKGMPPITPEPGVNSSDTKPQGGAAPQGKVNWGV